MRLRFRSLRSRIALLIALLLALVQGVAYFLVNQANRDNARATIASQLSLGERVFERLLDGKRTGLMGEAAALASHPAVREAAARGDAQRRAHPAEALLQGLAHHRPAGLAILIGNDGQVIADSSGQFAAGSPFPLPGLVSEARQRGASDGLARLESATYVLVLVPVPLAAPTPQAWLAVGHAIDESLARDLQGLAELEVSFVEQRLGRAHRVLASTLAADARNALLPALHAVAPGRTVGTSLVVAGRAFEARRIDLTTDGDVVVSLVLQRALDETLKTLDRARLLLVLLACASVPLSVWASVLIARSITRPLKDLSDAALRIQQGRYDEPIDTSSRDELGVLAQSLNSMRADIASREAQIMRLAYHDPLTGLPNRARLMQMLESTINRNAGGRAGGVVLVLNLDRIQVVNDTLGHAGGDAVLREVAVRLAGVVGEDPALGFLARLGGDEFAIVLAGADDLRGGEVARGILAALRPAMEVSGQPVDASASIGMATYPADGSDAGLLIQRASIAMVTAKRGNRAFAFYDARVHVTQREQLSLLGELRNAVEHSELRACYQPKIDLATGRVCGVEALVRWRHPKRGMLPPNIFMPYAEKTGFVRVITRWMLAVTLRQCGRWAADGQPLQVAVNLSTRDLMSAELPHLIGELLKTHQVPPHLVCLEITESSVMDDPDRALEVLLGLHGLGLKLSVDDFGTGFSSLTYLKKLPVDELKIDRSFVYRMIDDPDDRMIVRSTVELAHNLGLKVVAEGVETQACLEALRALGCDMAQGYLFSHALRRVKLEAWLRQSSWGLVIEPAGVAEASEPVT